MWLIETISTERTKLDRSSSGQADANVTQLVLDGVVAANAIECSIWDKSCVQVEVCEACGIEGCNYGGYLTLRRSGDFVLLLPAFEQMADKDTSEQMQPPRYVHERGVPVVARQRYDSGLRTLVATLPAFDALPALTGSELLRILQLEAPLRLLGTFPDPVALQPSLDILAASEGELDEWLPKLSKLLAAPATEVELHKVSSTDRPIELFLDNPVHAIWSPLALDANGFPHLASGSLLA